MFSAVNTLPQQVLTQLSQLTSNVITNSTVNPGVVRSNTGKAAAQKLRAGATAAVNRATATTALPKSNSEIPQFDSSNTQNSILEVPLPFGSATNAKNVNGLSLEIASKILLSSQSSNATSPLVELTQLLLPSGLLNLNAVSRVWDKLVQVSQHCACRGEDSLSSVKALLQNYKLIVGNISNLESNSKTRTFMRDIGTGIRNTRPRVPTPGSFKTLGSFELDRKFSPPFNFLALNVVPYRTFKTGRDKAAEDLRNPSLFARMKNKLWPPYPPLPKSPMESGSIGANPTIPQPDVNPKQQDLLRALMAELPPDEASRIKIAFAEGYIAAKPGQTIASSRTYRWLRTLQQVLFIAVFTAILASLMGSFGSGVFRVNVGNGNEVQPEDINVTFNDVKGVDEAKAELQEVVEFLRSPEKFVQLGGKLPKGVLLVGPPGTGKTLLARAVAGEAGVPFFHAAGPEFDEILVGQGARRVRDLFKAAKVKAPCVIFIDEIDSVGAKRTNSVLHPYANQTINQLLTEMDGFRQNEGVIVLGATNRREDLDKALLRPGRFDVEVNVPAPELKGRKEILEYYLGRVKKSDDVDVDLLARGTTGFTGADLENMVNQAALRAAIEGADKVFKKHLDFARDKVIMGPERKTRIPDEETNRITAYHEAGHAIVAHYTRDSNPLHKVTIIPRGQSLGHTAYIPEKERYHHTRSQMMASMDTMMGGRAAEELIFGPDKITSGASDDLRQATALASHMVKQWGMSEKVGLRTVDENNQSLVTVNELGNQASELIDKEINRLLNESYERAKAILRQHAKEHESLADALMKYETLDADDVKAIFSGQVKAISTKKGLNNKPPTPTPQSGPPSAPPAPPIGILVGKPNNPCP